MSHYMFMTADFPLKEREYQRPQSIIIETGGDNVIVKAGEDDPDFMVHEADEGLSGQVLSQKKYCFELCYDKLSLRGRCELAEYIKANLLQGDELELWNVWFGGDEDETSVEYWEVPADKFCETDIAEWDSCRPWMPEYIDLKSCEGHPEQWIERYIQYCMIIKG